MRDMMQYIKRTEQEAIVLTFEKEFSYLVKEVNRNNLSLSKAAFKAQNLVKEIRTLNKQKYFEDDLGQYLEGLATGIEEHIEVNILSKVGICSKYIIAFILSNLIPLPDSNLRLSA